MTPAARAAALFAAAFDINYEDDPWMTVTLHTASGSTLAVTGSATVAGDEVDFHPAETATLLTWMTAAMADPRAVLTVAVPKAPEGNAAYGWAWNLSTGEALPGETAATWFADPAVDAQETNEKLVPARMDLLPDYALTEPVKDTLTAHARPTPPPLRSFALRAPGLITVHIETHTTEEAHAALAAIEHEDFDMEFTTGGGHVIGHVTIDDAHGAELTSVDGLDVDELCETCLAPLTNSGNCFNGH